MTEALASEVFEARVESVARFVRDVDRPLDRRSNTLEPEDLHVAMRLFDYTLLL